MYKIGPKQQKTFLITSLIILVTLAVGLKIIYQPKQAKVIRLQAEVQKEKERHSLIKEIISLQDGLKRYQNKFSPQPQADWLKSRLEELARDLNIELIETKMKASPEISGFSQLTIEAKLKANYHQTGKLISRLERLPELVEVTDIKIVSASSEKWNELIQLGPGIVTAVKPPYGRKPSRMELEGGVEIKAVDWEDIFNKSQEAEVTLEVRTFYVQ